MCSYFLTLTRIEKTPAENETVAPEYHTSTVSTRNQRPWMLTHTRSTPHSLHPAPYTLHPTPYTLHPTPYTLHPTPYTLHPTPHTLHPAPYTPHPSPYTHVRTAPTVRPLCSANTNLDCRIEHNQDPKIWSDGAPVLDLNHVVDLSRA